MQSPLSVTVLKMELTTGLCEILGAPIGANKATSVFGAELTNVWVIFGLLGPKLFDPILATVNQVANNDVSFPIIKNTI